MEGRLLRRNFSAFSSDATDRAQGRIRSLYGKKERLKGKMDRKKKDGHSPSEEREKVR